MKRIVHGSRLKGSNGQKITNNTNIFGIMGGLAPMKNISAATHRSYRIGHARVHQDIPLDPEEGLEYMLGDNPMGKYLLSKNPQCAGGVGKMAILAKRGAYSKSTRSGGELMSGSLYDDGSFGDDYDDVNCGTCAPAKKVRAWYKGLNPTEGTIASCSAKYYQCFKSPTWATDCFHFRGATCAGGVCNGADVVNMLDQMFSPGYLNSLSPSETGGFACWDSNKPQCDLAYDSRYYDGDASAAAATDEKGNNQYPTPIEHTNDQKNWLVLGGGGTVWTAQILKSLVAGGSVDDFTDPTSSNPTKAETGWTSYDIQTVLPTLKKKKHVTWTNKNTFIPTANSGTLMDTEDYYKFNQNVIDNVKKKKNLKITPQRGVRDTIQHSGLAYTEGYKTFDADGEIIPELSDDEIVTITSSPMIDIVKALGYYGIIFDFEAADATAPPFTSKFLSSIFQIIKKHGLKVGVTCMQAKDFNGDFWNDVTKKDAPFFSLYDAHLFRYIDLISPQYYDNKVQPSVPTPDDYLNFQFIQDNHANNERKDSITIIPTIVSCGSYSKWEDEMKSLHTSSNLSYDGYAIWKPSCSNTPTTTRYKCNNGNCVPQKGGIYTTISACQAACGGGGGGGGCPTPCDHGYVCAKWWSTNPCSCIRQDSNPPIRC